jgi:hypothetical protein
MNAWKSLMLDGRPYRLRRHGSPCAITYWARDTAVGRIRTRPKTTAEGPYKDRTTHGPGWEQ